VNTHAPEALSHASPGEVTRGAPVAGKQQGGHGKNGSAGFAQILGEQVAKSTSKAEATEMTSEQFFPDAELLSSTHATGQLSPHSLAQPSTSTVSGKAGSQVLEHVRLETDAHEATLSPVKTSKFSTGTQQTEHQNAAIQSALAGEVTDESTDKAEGPTQAPVPHDKARPGQQQVGAIGVPGPAPKAPDSSTSVQVSTPAQTPAGHTTPASSQADHLSAGALGAIVDQAGDSVDMDTLEGVSGLPAMVRATQSSATPHASDRDTLEGVSGLPATVHAKQSSATSTPVHEHAHATATNHKWQDFATTPSSSAKEEHAPVATKAGETAVQVPSQPSNVAAHAQSTASNPTPQSSAETAEATGSVQPEADAFVVPLPSSSGESASPTALPSPSHAHAQGAKASAGSPVLHAQKTSSQVTHVASEVRPMANPSVDNEANVNEDTAGYATAHAQPSSPAQTLPHRETATAGATAKSKIQVHNDVPGATERPMPKEMEGDADVVPVAQVGSPSVPQPSPATAAQDLPSAQVPHNPKSTSAPEAFRPTETGTTRTPADRPTRPTIDKTQTSVRKEDEPAPSTTEAAPAQPSVHQPVISSQNSERPAKDPTASAKQSQESPSPAASQARNKSTLPVDPSASRRRTQVADDKESGESSTSPTPSAQATSLPVLASPNVGSEAKSVGPEALPSARHKTVADNASQSDSVPSSAGQPPAVRPELAPTIVSPAEHPAAFALSPTFLPAGSDASVHEASAPSTPAAQRTDLVDRAIADPGLSVTVMPHSAHLSIASDAGDLALHVRVRDGSADVNVSGSMAPLFDAKAPEVRNILAGEGLQLGSFATDQRGHSQGQQGQPESAPRTNDPHPLPPPRRASTSTPEVQIADDRRIHVTA